MATHFNANAASGYTEHTINLSAYAGKTVTLTFTGKENILAADLVRAG